MKRIYEIYDASSGEILKEATCNSTQAQYQFDTSAGEDILLVDEHVNPELYYISGDALIARPSMGISLNKANIDADGVDQAVISNIPAGTMCYMPGGEEECNDGSIEFSADAAGAYRISLENFPYKKEEIVIYAS